MVSAARRAGVERELSEAELLALEDKYCSHGDTVHYTNPPKIFDRCEGSFIYDAEGREFLDLQMWYSAVNFGYRNERLNDAVRRQLDRLPQVASQYLHREKIELAALIAQDAEQQVRREGPRALQCRRQPGGRGQPQARAQLQEGQEPDVRVRGRLSRPHARRLRHHLVLPLSPPLRPLRRPRAVRAVPLSLPRPQGHDARRSTATTACKQFERLFESEYNGVWDPKVGEAEYAAFYVEPIQGTGGYVIPPKNFFIELKRVLDKHGILLVVDEIQMGFYRTGKLWSIEHFGVKPDIIVFGKAITNGLNPLAGVWAREELINPTIFPPGSTHSTFNANPMGTAVALEAMKMMAETDYEAMVMEKGAYLLEGLQDLKRRHKIVGDVDGLGLALRMEICEPHDSFTPSKAIVDRMVDEALKGDLEVDGRKYGLVLDIGGYYKNVVTLAPSLHITKHEMDLALKLLDRVMQRVSKT